MENHNETCSLPCVERNAHFLTFISEQIGNSGTKFVFTLSENYALRYNASIIVVNRSPAEVHANITFRGSNVLENITIPIGKHKTVYLPNSVVLKKDEGAVIQDGIALTSDHDVIVQVYNDVHHRSMDGFLALPARALGKEYYVMAYTPWVQSQLALVAIEDGTEIDFFTSHRFHFIKSTMVEKGVRFRIDLDELEAVQLQCEQCDFTGSRIVSNKPIAVFTGNRCAFVPVGIESCDHLVEQVPPATQWGKTFIATALVGRLQNAVNRFRVIAARYGTEIAIGAKSVSLKPGQWHDFQLGVNETTLVVSNKPILLAQFSSGFEADNITGDPSMTLVPSLEQRVNTSTFVTYNKTQEQTDVTNFISVHADCDDLEQISLDGRLLTSIPDTVITPVELTNYCVGSIEVSRKGMHTITGNTNTTTFTAILYGFAYYNSFAHPVAMGFKDTLCTATLRDGAGTFEHDCNQQVVAVQMPCMEPTTSLPDIECNYDNCVKPGKGITVS